jgi:hypothetical protein
MPSSGLIIREARVFHFNSTDHKANSIGSGHASPDHNYLQAVAESVADAAAVLITGPTNANTELTDHIRLDDPVLAKIIAGIKTVDPSERSATRRLCENLPEGDGPGCSPRDQTFVAVTMSGTRLKHTARALSEAGALGLKAKTSLLDPNQTCPGESIGVIDLLIRTFALEI